MTHNDAFIVSNSEAYSYISLCQALIEEICADTDLYSSASFTLIDSVTFP